MGSTRCGTLWFIVLGLVVGASTTTAARAEGTPSVVAVESDAAVGSEVPVDVELVVDLPVIASAAALGGDPSAGVRVLCVALLEARPSEAGIRALYQAATHQRGQVAEAAAAALSRLGAAGR